MSLLGGERACRWLKDRLERQLLRDCRDEGEKNEAGSLLIFTYCWCKRYLEFGQQMSASRGQSKTLMQNADCRLNADYVMQNAARKRLS